MLPKIKYLLSVLSAALIALSTHASAASELNMPNGPTDISLQTFDLNVLITIICAVIGMAAYGVLIWSLIKYRKANVAKSDHFHGNIAIEIIWTIIPIVILVAMVIPSIHVIT